MTQIPQADTPTDHYDAWNRLVKLEDAGGVVATYEYNGLGHRVQKTVGGAGGDTHDTYYNQDWQALEVRKNGSLHPYEQFVYDGGYIDAPFMRYVDADTDGILDEGTDGEQYYLRDASFSVVALLDEAGTAIERYRYTPYGKRVAMSNAFIDKADTDYGQQRGFQGLLHDEESGLIENRHRMFDPGTGRFLQRDPLGYPDGMNAYAAYHGMNGGVDPWGLYSEEEVDRIAEEEGFRPKVYLDTSDPPKRTIGYGTNLDAPGAREAVTACGLDFDALREGRKTISRADAKKLLLADIDEAEEGAQRVMGDCWARLDQESKDILTHMAYQLGATGLSRFRRMKAALCEIPPDYCEAADEMLDSRWARQTPGRARRLADRMRAICQGECDED